jgi:hypothetical protein
VDTIPEDIIGRLLACVRWNIRHDTRMQTVLRIGGPGEQDHLQDFMSARHEHVPEEAGTGQVPDTHCDG